MSDVRFDAQNITFTPLENGLDFILRALEYLADDPTKRDLKYAVLHLHSGIELILKERLRREHWSLVFEKPEEANKEIYKSGEFISVQWKTCLSRLHGICEVKIDETQRRVLEELKKKRNRLEHFGTVDTAIAVKGATVLVLNFAINFINEELVQDSMSEIELGLLNQIRENLGKFREFVASRLKSIEKELASYGKGIVTCPRCFQVTMAIDDGVICFFCGHRQKEVDDALQDFVYEVLGIDWHSVARGADWPVYQCPGCSMETLLDIGAAEQFDKPRFICFYCGNHWDRLDFCGTCGQPFEPNEMAVCDECFEWSVRRND